MYSSLTDDDISFYCYGLVSYCNTPFMKFSAAVRKIKVNISDVVSDSYSVRDARLHLRHVCDLLKSLDLTDAYNGVNGSSLSYLTFYTRGDRGRLVLSLVSPGYWSSPFCQ